MAEVPEGIEAPAVIAWLVERVELTEPVDFELFTRGRSNLTYLVSDAAGRRWVLRRPPLSDVLATAHDMAREHKILTGLAHSAVPVPACVGLEPTGEVNQAPFYVMEHVEGHIIRTAADFEVVPVEHRRQAGEELADVLAAIHAVVPAEVGLDDLGRHDGYLERQLTRWRGQLDASPNGPEPGLVGLHDRLAPLLPAQHETTIVHGDYRLDNCLVSESGHLEAVLDWELCTLGDPMADLGLLVVYNSDDEHGPMLPDTPIQADGAMDLADTLARYTATSGRELEHLDVHVAFAFWKLGCIIGGVADRYLSGAMGGETSEGTGEMFAFQRDRCTAAAHSRLDGARLDSARLDDARFDTAEQD